MLVRAKMSNLAQSSMRYAIYEKESKPRDNVFSLLTAFLQKRKLILSHKRKHFREGEIEGRHKIALSCCQVCASKSSIYFIESVCLFVRLY